MKAEFAPLFETSKPHKGKKSMQEIKLWSSGLFLCKFIGNSLGTSFSTGAGMLRLMVED